MAVIRPFRALRPTPDKAEIVASPPYDVVNTEQARAIAKDNAHSFLHVVRSEIDLPEGTDPYSDAVYTKAIENLNRLIQEGVLITDDEPALYVYSQRMGGHFQTGIVACCCVDDYDSDVIKKHEKTRREKEDDRTHHILATSAQTGPVFLMYRDVEEIDVLIEDARRTAPLYSFAADDDVEHTVHRITDESCIKSLIEQFAKIEHLYVADGHHRSAAASRARAEKRKANPHHTGQEEYNYFMAVLFPASTLKILPYNRVVKDVRGLPREELFHKIREHFILTETTQPKPGMKGHFGMYYTGKWYRLTIKPWTHHLEDIVMNLDTNVLQEFLLGPILGISAPRMDKRIQFVGGSYGADELKRRVDNGEAEIAFLLHPVTVDNLMKIADIGKTMPPKSTWFEPKLKSGLLIHQI